MTTPSTLSAEVLRKIMEDMNASGIIPPPRSPRFWLTRPIRVDEPERISFQFRDRIAMTPVKPEIGIIAAGIDYDRTRIVETIHATKPVEDWSKVRSKSRTRRRMKAGIPNRNIVVRYEPSAYLLDGVLYAHPEYVRALRQSLVDELDANFLRMVSGAPL